MATITELVGGKDPWTIKVSFSHPDNNEYEWFNPYYYAKGIWYGLDHEGDSMDFTADCEGWEIWTPPKKRLYKFRMKHVNEGDGYYWDTSTFYENEEDAEDSNGLSEVIKRLDDTMIEVDDA